MNVTYRPSDPGVSISVSVSATLHSPSLTDIYPSLLRHNRRRVGTSLIDYEIPKVPSPSVLSVEDRKSML